MPAEYMAAPEPRKLRNLGIGETAYTDRWNIRVDRHGRTFVELSNSAKESKEVNNYTIEVRRERRGFVVKFPPVLESMKFTPYPLVPITPYEPVLRIDVAEELKSPEPPVT
jgi:hypothetical protein